MLLWVNFTLLLETVIYHNFKESVTMKKLLQTTLIVFALTMGYQSANAQSSGGIGIKGGLNYNSNGRYFQDAQAAWGDPFSNLGFHMGLFGKVNAGPVFFRPEVIYTQINSEVNNANLRTQRLDVPVLVGLNLLGPLVSVFAGPSLHYYLEDELRDFDFNRYNAGYQLGVGVNLGNLGLDLRYEKVLNSQTVSVDNVFSGDDLRFQQLILGLSFKF
jgi:opacity protein-like surface antigen